MPRAPVIRFLTPELPSSDAIEAYFARSRELRWFSNGGPCLELFVERCAAALGRGLAVVPTANGTLALMLALRALADSPRPGRAEVVLPSFTFAALPAAVIWSGFTPVFVDVEPGSWHLSAGALRNSLEERGDRVAAVVATSTFGTGPPLDLTQDWSQLAREAGVPLLVDSAAGFGARDERGDLLGGQGDAEVFSFHATKPFAIGEGGAVATRVADLPDALRRLANFGFGAERTVDDAVGLNAKMDEWHAAAGLAALDRLEEVLGARRERAERLRALLEPAGFGFQDGCDGSTWQFVPTLAPTPEVREAVVERAAQAGIEVRTYFDPPLHEMPAFAGFPRVGALEETCSLAALMLSLPMANDLADDALERVASCVLGAVESVVQ